MAIAVPGDMPRGLAIFFLGELLVEVPPPAPGKSGLLGVELLAAPAPPASSDGNTLLACSQSVQPSRQTSESALTRPSPIHLRITSPRAGPYCPPEGGRTYQVAVGFSAIGSAGAAGAVGMAAASIAG